jgi:large subunit ribosomal protein L4
LHRLSSTCSRLFDLPAELFDVPANIPLIHQVVVAQLAAARQGTHATKVRGDVRGGGKKPYRQKGTGGARHGSRNAPIFVGGGVAHGPHPHSHAHGLPKKVRAMAMKHALSAKVKDEALIVLDGFEGEKTKDLVAQLKALGIKNALFIGGSEVNEKFAKSARNIPNIDVLPLAGLNVYDVLRRKTLVLSREAVEGVNARFAEAEKA